MAQGIRRAGDGWGGPAPWLQRWRRHGGPTSSLFGLGAIGKPCSLTRRATRVLAEVRVLSLLPPETEAKYLYNIDR